MGVAGPDCFWAARGGHGPGPGTAGCWGCAGRLALGSGQFPWPIAMLPAPAKLAVRVQLVAALMDYGQFKAFCAGAVPPLLPNNQFNLMHVLTVRANCGGGKKAESRRRVSASALALI